MKTIASIKLTAQDGSSIELFALTGEAKGEMKHDKLSGLTTIQFNFNGEIGGFDVNPNFYKRETVLQDNDYFGMFNIDIVDSSNGDAATNEYAGTINSDSESHI